MRKCVAYHRPDDKEKFDELYKRHLKVFEENAEKFVEGVMVIRSQNLYGHDTSIDR